MTFKVEIVNTSENIDNIILVSGMTIERLKIKYNWVLNASVKNCILGEDENGLVWFSGEWICGEWENGTWYSGIWHDGIWDNGKWYSYLLDTAMVISNRFVILDKNSTYSEFRSGLWEQGDFYDGTFGYDRVVSGMTYYDLTGRTFSTAYWLDGKFHTGIFKNSVWYNGIFYAGNMIQSYWLYGKFYNGTFARYDWYNGLWYGGDFVEGNWYDGSFYQIDSNIKSRFGTANLELSQTKWWKGTFYNGEFHSGLNIDVSGNTIPSIDNNKTHWIQGNFNGGKWYGGHFHNGNFYNGYWYGGIFNTNTGSTHYTDCTWHNGIWYNGLWINGTWMKGHFYDGMIIDGLFLSGYLSTNTVEGNLLPPSPSARPLLPTVITSGSTSITYNSAIGNGRVINNGGATILDRGICWTTDINNDPVTGNTSTNHYVSDGGSMGNINILMGGLLSGITYYVRAYAMNVTGLTYGDPKTSFITTQSTGIPSVQNNGYSSITQSSVLLNGIISSIGGDVILGAGFYCDTTDPPTTTYYTTFIGSVPIYFNLNVTGLTASTTYYFIPFAENSIGVGVGTKVSFTTSTVGSTSPPSIISGVTTNIIDVSAVANGNITDNGNAPITAYGACWSTSSNPTTSDPHTNLGAGGTGAFSTTMTGLVPNTIYHVRVYATNSAGTTYATDTSFRTLIYTPPTIIMIGCSPA